MPRFWSIAVRRSSCTSATATARRFFQTTKALLADDDRRQAMRKAMRDVAVIDSADRIYRILLELAETRRA